MFPLGLNGPCSQKAPAPIDEQPGPSNKKNKKIKIHTKTNYIWFFFFTTFEYLIK